MTSADVERLLAEAARTGGARSTGQVVGVVTGPGVAHVPQPDGTVARVEIPPRPESLLSPARGARPAAEHSVESPGGARETIAPPAAG